MQILVVYWIIINIIGILSMWADKRKAQRSKWRIPEHTLIAIAILGGSVGSFLGMHLFHHKTRHLKFAAGIPAIFIIQVALLLFVRFSLPNFL